MARQHDAIQRAFTRLSSLPPAQRAAAARSTLAHDPVVLREVLRLLPHAAPPTRFLKPPTGIESATPEFSEPDATPGRLLGGRYRLVRHIGRGGGGVVMEAFDEVAKERVAVKLIRGLGADDLRRIRREVATVRWLALPGVVRFRDDGIDGEDVWCVTDFVVGRPFPGGGRRRRWERIEPVALGLVETMARVHWAGVIHRDLKPHNVLVDDAGRATVLDLGLAAPRDEGLVGASDDVTGGTRGYAAPEQLAGRPADARADVFAIGVMLFEGLAGRLPGPHGAAECRRLTAPPRVRRAIARMIANDPARRPATMAAVLVLLRPARRGGRRRRPWSRAELKGMFAGFDRIHHLPTDAAAEMHRRTGGDPGAVEAEIAAWVRAGLARPEGERYFVDRVALERLRRVPPCDAAGDVRLAATTAERKLMRALRTGDPADVYRAAVAAGQEARADGRPLRAGAAFAQAVQAARAARREAWEARALHLQLLAAIAASERRGVEEARFAISQARAESDDVRRLAQIAHATLEVFAGRAPDAARVLAAVARGGSKELRRMAWAVRAAAVQQLGPAAQARFLVEARRWTLRDGSRAARLAFMDWTAHGLYSQSRFREALRSMLQLAQAQRRRPWAHAAALVDAARIAIEGGETELAARLSARGRAIAARRRMARVEGSAEMVRRSSIYRSGALVPEDPALVQMLTGLGTAILVGVVRVTEAAFAWRARRFAAAAALAMPGPVPPDPSLCSVIDLVLFALAAASGTAISERDALRAAQTAAARCPPAVATQVLALLALAHPGLRARLRKLAAPIAGHPGPAADSARREVLSLEECRAILER